MKGKRSLFRAENYKYSQLLPCGHPAIAVTRYYEQIPGE